jgi:ribulose-phosphate 3-epimerase
MSVEPGFGGQKYIEEVNGKIEKLFKLRYENDLRFEIEVDGGINLDNIGKVSKCGVDIFVAGSAVFKEEDREKAILKLKDAIK